MLRKLLKYEFIYLVKDFVRTYIIYGITVLILTLLVSLRGSSGSPAYVSLTTIFAIIYYIFTLVLALMTISHNVRRFKKNMFSHEGYLTNTLPVTPSQHVIAKAIAGAVNYVISFVVIFLGLVILSAGAGQTSELMKGLDFAFELLDNFGMLLPAFLMLATGYLALLMCCYLVSAVGNMVGGSKVKSAMLAVGLVIGYIMFTVMLTSAAVKSGASSEGIMYIYSIFYAAGAAIEFAVVINIIKNDLNLQ